MTGLNQLARIMRAADKAAMDCDDDPDGFLRWRSHSTPEIRARAQAEWAAMDAMGRLPDGWAWEPGR